MSKYSKFRRIRFKINDDLLLLKEVLRTNPFKFSNRWNEIARNLTAATGRYFRVRTVKQHFYHLLNLFNSEDIKNLKKSSTEQQYDEKEYLLRQIQDLSSEVTKGINVSASDHSRSGEETADCSKTSNCLVFDPIVNILPDDSPMTKITDDVEILISDEDSTVFAESSTNILGANYVCQRDINLRENASTLRFLREKLRSDAKLREKEMELEEKKLSIAEKRLRLEQEKVAFDKLQREKRLQLESEERKHMMLLSEQQQKIINYLLEGK